MNHTFIANNSFYPGLNNSIPNRLNIMPNNNNTMIHGRRQLFSYEEDEQLKKLVEQFGDKDWKFIARRMPGRSTRQCRERYKNYLSPEIKNGPWTKEEDELLKEKYNEYGPHWSSISKFFKSRSDVNIKNRWSALSFHMNHDNNINRNLFLYIPRSLQKKTKVLYPMSQNPCFQEPNYNPNLQQGCVPMMPPNYYCSNMNQTLNYPQHQPFQPHLISNPSYTNINANNSEKLNNDENETLNEDEISDETLPPQINQPPKPQNNEIKNIMNDPMNVTVQPNTDNSSISLSSVPMSVNFSGPLPPLLQKPKMSLHSQQSQQSSLLNPTIDSTEEASQRRNISSPSLSNQLNPNSPLPSEDNHSRSSLSQQDELKFQRSTRYFQIQIPYSEKEDEKAYSLQQHSKEDISNSNNNSNNSCIQIVQIRGPSNTNNNSAQVSSSQSTNLSTPSSNQSHSIHKTQSQQHSQVKQTTVSSTSNTSESNPNSNFSSNFPFPQSILSYPLLNPSDQQESILASDARIDDASINTETEVLTNTFPNFGGRLW